MFHSLERSEDMAGESCKQTEVIEVEEQATASRKPSKTFPHSFLGVPALKHETLGLYKQREKSVRLSVGRGVMPTVWCADLVPAESVGAQTQVTVRA